VKTEGTSVAIAVKKKMGAWTYDLNNLTRTNGTKKVIPGQEITLRKYIIKYNKEFKYKFELVCNGKKVDSREF
jgi:hypothetical protein